MSKDSTEVIVIGAGTIGCAITYYLAKNGIRVRLIERNSVGSGNSSLAASLLTKIRGKRTIIPLIDETYKAIISLNEEVENKLEIQKVGSLHLAASESSIAALEELLTIADEFNIVHSAVANAEIRKMVPWLNVDEIHKSSFMPDDAFLDAYLLANAFAEASKRHGAVIQQFTNVEGIISDGNNVIGVKTGKDSISCDVVVDAAGAWSNLLSLQAGIPLPMTPVRSNYWITSSMPDLVSPNQPIVILPDASVYTRPENTALLFGLRESKSVYFDPRNLPDDITGFTFGDPEDQWNILIEEGSRLQRFFPKFDEVSIQHYIAGVSTYTPDGMYVIGGVPGINGFLAATGCSGAGVAASGGIGRIISEMVLGLDEFCDVDPFRIDRFGDIDPLSHEFMRRCANTRSGKTSG